MGALNLLQTALATALGSKTVAASTSGSANARASAAFPLAVGSTGVWTRQVATSNQFPLGTTGEWTTAVSSGTLSAHMLVSANASNSGLQAGSPSGLAQVAAGAVGSEVVVFSFWYRGGGTPSLILPPGQWPTNERASVRTNAVGGSTARTTAVSLAFAPRPL